MSNNKIEEDIQIVEELLKDFNCKETDYIMLFYEKAKSIENLLNAYIHEKVAKEEVEELLENSISEDKIKEIINKYSYKNKEGTLTIPEECYDFFIKDIIKLVGGKIWN